ncbi:MAG: hypothetical protein QOD44_4131, partial [Solirubrobacteraceae bacterium]|nr:hypothetical protein [Solirubrobacteraceae bacterium]
MPGRLLAACLLTAALALTSAATADANLYKQYTCKLPSGAPAATDGWATDDAAGSFVYDDDCSRSIALRTTMDPLVNAGVQRAWTWTAPPGTALHGVEVFRAFSLTPGRADATPTATIVSGANVIESHGGVSTGTRLSWNDPANRLVVARERLGSNLKVTLGCVGSVGGVCPDSGSSEVRAFAATFTLSDASAPTVTNVAGTLADDGEKRGVQSLSIAASDTGS